MFNNGISFQKFDLNSNVLVKSLKQDETNKGYWQYRINGINFYIPNYGYMVMINLDFANIIENDEQTLRNQIENPGRVGLPANVYGLGIQAAPAVIIAGLDDNSTRILDKTAYKIYSDELLVHKTSVNMARNRLRTLENMRDAFNPNRYNKEFTLNGGVKPDDRILRIISEINIEVNKIINKEKPVFEIAELAEARAFSSGITDEEAAGRVGDAAGRMFKLAKQYNIANPDQVGKNAEDVQINLEKIKSSIEILENAELEHARVTPAPPAAVAASTAAYNAVINAFNVTIPLINNVIPNIVAIGIDIPNTVVDVYNYYAAKIVGVTSIPVLGLGVVAPVPVPTGAPGAYTNQNITGNQDSIVPKLTIDANSLVENVILKFKDFLHNRVGTSLKESERESVPDNNNDNIAVGELVLYTVKDRWAVVTDITSDNVYNIITYNQDSGIDTNVNTKLTIIKDVNIGELRRPNTVIEQISKPNQKLSDNDLLETYELRF